MKAKTDTEKNIKMKKQDPTKESGKLNIWDDDKGASQRGSCVAVPETNPSVGARGQNTTWAMTLRKESNLTAYLLCWCGKIYALPYEHQGQCTQVL